MSSSVCAEGKVSITDINLLNGLRIASLSGSSPLNQYSPVAGRPLIKIDQIADWESSRVLGGRPPTFTFAIRFLNQILKRISMTPIVQVGTILIGEESPRITEVLALQSEPYFGNWSVVKALDGFTLGDKIHAARWNFIFMADEIKATFLGAVGASKVRGALQQIAQKAKEQNFNCLEVTGIAVKSFLGVPYTTVSAHSRHIQQGYRLESTESRRNGRRGAERAKGR